MLTAILKTKAYIVGVLLAASVFLFGVAAAFGDSYTVNIVTHTQYENFVGIDTFGDFVVNLSNSMIYPGSSCGGVTGAATCFETFYVGGGPSFSTAAPSLDWDNGSPCTVGVLTGVCNNGHELLGGYLDGVRGVWAGTGRLTEILPGGSYDGGYINALGDAVFIDGADDTLVSVVAQHGPRFHTSMPAGSQPVPEPPSLWLFGMGMIASAMLIRRRAYSRVAARR